MDPEKKGQKQDNKDIASILKSGKDLFKKKTNQFAMFLRKIPAFIAALPFIFKVIAVIVLVAIITTVFTAIKDFFGSSNTAGVASMSVIRNEVTLTKAERR